MVHRIRVVRVMLEDLRELLGRAVIVHVIKVLEGFGIQGIGWPKHKALCMLCWLLGQQKAGQ